MEGSTETSAAEIKALQGCIWALGKSASQATAQCKQEHEEHEALPPRAPTAKKGLGWAKIRLSKLYVPSLQKPRWGTSF